MWFSLPNLGMGLGCRHLHPMGTSLLPVVCVGTETREGGGDRSKGGAERPDPSSWLAPQTSAGRASPRPWQFP